MSPKKILDKMLNLTNELSKLNKELEDQEISGAEWLVVNNIEKAVGVARTIFEQRLDKET